MFKHKLMTLALIGAGAFGLSAMPAAAFTVPAPPAMEQGVNSSLLTEVQNRNDRRAENRNNRRGDVRRDNNRGRVVVWNRARHGNRCRTRYGSCRHFYNGYYYSSPWWTLPLVGAAVIIGSSNRGGGYGNAHVRWCEDHYRSYNRRSNTWISYGGEIRQCNSPY